MSITTMELYDALISVGVEESKAKAAAETVMTRSEAQQLATKADVSAAVSGLRAEIYKALATQTIVTIGAIVGLLQLLS